MHIYKDAHCWIFWYLNGDCSQQIICGCLGYWKLLCIMAALCDKMAQNDFFILYIFLGQGGFFGFFFFFGGGGGGGVELVKLLELFNGNRLDTRVGTFKPSF